MLDLLFFCVTEYFELQKEKYHKINNEFKANFDTSNPLFCHLCFSTKKSVTFYRKNNNLLSV